MKNGEGGPSQTKICHYPTGPRNHVVIFNGKRQFGRFVCPTYESRSSVYAAKGIIQSSITTAAVDCNARNHSVSHYVVPREKSAPCKTAMQLFVRILWFKITHYPQVLPNF